LLKILTTRELAIFGLPNVVLFIHPKFSSISLGSYGLHTPGVRKNPSEDEIEDLRGPSNVPYDFGIRWMVDIVYLQI
jgi:hypothetical protein